MEEKNEKACPDTGELRRQLEETRAQLARERIRTGLMSALYELGAVPGDVDYLLYRAENDAELARMTEDADFSAADVAEALRKACPSHFAAAPGKEKDPDENAGNGLRVAENRLPARSPGDDALSAEDLEKMSYRKRVELFNRDPDAYRRLVSASLKNRT